MGLVRIAVDADGGDGGTPVVVQGVLEARRLWGDAFSVVLCGDRTSIESQLASCGGPDTREWLSVLHCPAANATAQAPSQVWRRQPDSSIVKSIALQRDGEVDATVSAGDTGVLMATSVFLLGRQEGVARPALAATVPTALGARALLLDVGANINCRAEHLVSFAELGAAFMHRYYSTARARVALLNVGEEHFKGTQAIGDANAVLKERMAGYQGYIEGARVLSGDADVIVCDGFAGNVMLKVCESFYALTGKVLAADPELLANVTRRMAVLNAENYGAVPFLGVVGVVLKAHGRSSAHAVTSAVGTTISVVKQGAIPLNGASSPRRREHSYAR